MRKYYLDNIRWVTIVLVVIYHVIYMFNGVATAGVIGPFSKRQYQDGIQYLLYPWFMMLLFIVSGMCARYYLEKRTVREFVRSRTQKLLVPSTVGLLVAGWVQGYVSMSISGAFDTLPDTIPGIAMYLIMVLSGTGVLWFIQMLWLFSMLLAVIKKFEKGKLYQLGGRANIWVMALLAVPVYLSGLFLNTPIIAVYRFGIYGFTFLLGYFVFAHEEVTDAVSKHSIWLLAATVALGVIYLALHFGDNYAVTPTVNCISASAYGWFACLAIMGCMKKWGNTRSAFSVFMTKRSFGLYVFHYLPLSATAYGLHKYTHLPALPVYLIVLLAAFAGSFALYETIVRIPVLRWCILGIGKGKGNV